MNISNTTNFSKLYGVYGTFKAPGKKYHIDYLLTNVNARDDRSTSYAKLLQEMKPLRNRIQLSNINNLDDLLQRDVNDKRVSQSIISYLLNLSRSDNSLPIFFPSVLVVLIPSRTFGENDQFYPEITDNLASEGQIDYKNHWRLKRIPETSDPSKYSNIAELEINFSNTYPIVIDGQHRTTAFRHINNSTESQEVAGVYSVFYDQNDPLSENQLSDLPVTIIWINSEDSESSTEQSSDEDLIDIKKISRRIFVDVNQNPEYISKSRLILLHDSQPASFITRAFYKYLVSNKGHKTDDFSLLHCGFDYPYDVSQKKPFSPTSLFVPEQLCYALQWKLFGSSTYRNLDVHKVARERRGRLDSQSFDNYFGEGCYSKSIKSRTDIDGNLEYVVKKDNIVQLEQLVLDRYGRELYILLKTNKIYRAVVDITNNIDNRIRLSEEVPYNDPTHNTTWRQVYLGGDGLYYVLNSDNSPKTDHYRNSIKSIDAIIAKEFSLSFEVPDGEMEKLSTFTSTAHLVGFIMAFDFIFKQSQMSFSDATLKWQDILSQINWNDFITFLHRCRTSYLKNIDPKSWPRFRNIYIRFIHEIFPIYSAEDVHLEKYIEKEHHENSLRERLKQQGIVPDRGESLEGYFSQTSLNEIEAQSRKYTEGLFDGLESLEMV